MKDKKTSKKGIIVILCASLLVGICSICFITNKNKTDDKTDAIVAQDDTTQVSNNSTDDKDKDNDYNCKDEWGFTYRTYDGLLVPYYYNTDFPEEKVESFYVYNKIPDLYAYLPAEYKLEDTTMESRGIVLDIVKDKTTDKKVYIEHQPANGDYNVFYAKISSNFNDDIKYYKFSVTPIDDKDNYEVKTENVSFEDIKDEVTKFNETPNAFLDDRTYANYLYEYYASQGVIGWEGYSEPLSPDLMMKIMGYN